MIRLAKRALEAAILIFAFYAFATVPLGQRTGLEHLKLVLGTKEAKDAGKELKQAGGRLLEELLQFETGELRGEPDLPAELLLPGPSQLPERAE